MKTSITISLIFSILILTVSYSFSTPLNGTYTIGSGGTYPAINSAFSSAYTQGINGPVIFEIISGIYNETVSINNIPGNSFLNTLTLTSQSDNSSDVTIQLAGINSSNIFIRDLSLESDIFISRYSIKNINFINNDFLNHSLYVENYSFTDYTDINITENWNVGGVTFVASALVGLPFIRNIQIKNNIIKGSMSLLNCSNVLIEKNTITGNIQGTSFYGIISKNKITGSLNIGGQIYNNFILGSVQTQIYAVLKYNTIIGGSLETSTVAGNDYGIAKMFNNIIINPSGGIVLSRKINASDYNEFYNGGNSNLFYYGGDSYGNSGTYYNNIANFFNATGFDQHSSSQPVTFQSSTDLHLAGSSIGDLQLIGIPDALVPDDIDGQLRSLTQPYKGADEADFPLPVELTSFTSSVSLNNVQLNWKTASEFNNFGFDLERSSSNNSWIKIVNVSGIGNSTITHSYSYTDRNLSSGKYNYRLKQIDFNGNFEYFNLSNEVNIGVPSDFNLSQNYPNPFNPTTNLEFGISELGFVTLKVYDISGKEVMTLVNEQKTPGYYTVSFNGANLSSGIYFYSLNSANFVSTKKMTLIK